MRSHSARFDRYECGEGNSCEILGTIATVAGGLLGGLFGDDDSSNEVSYSVYDEDAANRILSDAEALYVSGDLVPLPNETTLAGRESVLGYATEDLPGLVSAAQESWLEGLSGEISPYTQDIIDAAKQNLFQDYQREILPGIANDAIKYGGYGGSRQGVAQGLAAEGLIENLANVETQLLSDAYTQSQEQQQAAWNVLEDMLSSGTLSGYLQQEVGEQYTEDERNEAANLEAFSDLVSQFTTPTATTSSGSGSTLSNIVGGMSTGYGLYNALANSNANANASAGSSGLLGSGGETVSANIWDF